MKTFTFVKGIVPLLTLALFAVSTSAQTVTLNPSAAQNISTGGTVNFTATRSSNSQTWPGGNGQFTYTWSSNPAGVTFTNNPNTTSNSSSGTVATFPSNGTYQITCFVQEGGGLNAFVGRIIYQCAEIFNLQVFACGKADQLRSIIGQCIPVSICCNSHTGYNIALVS